MKLALAVALVLAACGPALAGSSWTYQDTKQSTAANDVALAMRSGLAWPVIFAQPNTIALLPTGWQVVGANLVGTKPKAASSPLGEVAAIGERAATMGYSGVHSTSLGWAPLTADAIDYDSLGTLWTATRTGEVSYLAGGSWHSLPSLGGGYGGILIAAAPSGEIGVVTFGAELQYHHYSVLTGGWTHSGNLTDGEAPMVVGGLEFDAHNRPHIIGAAGELIKAKEFDVPSGTWVTRTLFTCSSSPPPGMPTAVSGSGEVATAFVSGSQIHLLYKPQDGEWTDSILPAMPGGAMPDPGGLGLAYDFDDLPVIAFRSGPNMWLAYDPVDLPEPIGLGLLALGLLGLRKRRQRT